MSASLDLILQGGSKTITAGTPEAIASGNREQTLTKLLMVRAFEYNYGFVYVGDESVTNTAYLVKLWPGDAVIIKKSDQEWSRGESINMSRIYINVDATNDGVYYGYERSSI